MKTLIIMRHGNAENWAKTDYERKLTPEGYEAVNEAAMELRRRQAIPQLILSSAAARAAQTANRTAGVLGVPETQIILEKQLYHIDDYELLRTIQHNSEDISILMIVGHNPAVSALASGLSGEMRSLRPAGITILRDAAATWHDFGQNITEVR